MIFATDLDRTIIHSSKFIDNTSHVKCIEILDDKEISYMSHLSIELINKIKNNPNIQLIPITTRSCAQFKRVQPVQNFPYAVVANGGIILHNGEPLPEWEKHVDTICRRLEDQYPNILKLLNQYKTHLTKEPVLIDDIFFFTKISDDKTTISYIDDTMTKELEGTEWTHTIQGIKLYIIPKEISKGNALRFLKEKLGEDLC